MSMEDDDRHDKAVYWEATGKTDKFGNALVLAPVEIDVRWENRATQVMGRDHKPIAVVAVLVLGQDVPVGSIFWKGELADVASASDYLQCEVYTDTPDIKGIEHRRLAYVVKYGDKLPSIAAGT